MPKNTSKKHCKKDPNNSSISFCFRLTASPLVSQYRLIHSCSFGSPFEPRFTMFDPDRMPWFQLKAHRVGGLHGCRKLQGAGASLNGWHGERWSLRMGVPGQNIGEGEGEPDLELKLLLTLNGYKKWWNQRNSSGSNILWDRVLAASLSKIWVEDSGLFAYFTVRSILFSGTAEFQKRRSRQRSEWRRTRSIGDH